MAHPLNPLALLGELQRAGSLHAADSRLDRTPSALSKMVRALEQQAGVALVEHGSKPLRLTDFKVPASPTYTDQRPLGD